jgi:hypothetical protein
MMYLMMMMVIAAANSIGRNDIGLTKKTQLVDWLTKTQPKKTGLTKTQPNLGVLLSQWPLNPRGRRINRGAAHAVTAELEFDLNNLNTLLQCVKGAHNL